MQSPSSDTLDRGAEQLADTIELHLLRASSQGLNAADVRALLHSAAGSNPASADLALNVMERRQRLLGERYPFRISPVAVRRIDDLCLSPYTCMLLQSWRRAPFRTTSGGMSEAASVFESVTAVATKNLLGPAAIGIRFGWPSAEGRPREFPDAIRWLAERMGVPVGSSYRPPRRQDGGVDVVAWRPFGDGQPGFPILLAQCTLERDFVHKCTDIDLRVWAGWLAFDTDPLTALAIPYTVEKKEDWREMASRVIVLDRIRLAGLVHQDEPIARAWAEAELSRSPSEAE